MDIIGVGTQVLDCARVRKMIDAHADKFVREVYTPREAAYCRDRTSSTEYYAAVWAAKEAVYRALGTKWRKGMDWTEVEIVCAKAATPTAELTRAAKARMKARGATRVLVSFSYTRLFATATAIAVSG